MDQQLAAEILTGTGKELTEIKANLTILEHFLELAARIDHLPNIGKRFYEESRSLYQATVTGSDIAALESLLSEFFGPPAKPAGKSLPRKLRKNVTVTYLRTPQTDQSLFLKPLKKGEFYGALWPWQRSKGKIEIHLGYCSKGISDQDYEQLETLVKRHLSRDTFEQVNTGVGGLIRGISLPSFLQMAEMEQATFCLRVTAGSNNGLLHVRGGVLLDAKTEELAGREAAYRIISWDHASIEIMPPPDANLTNAIKQPLMHVLMESLKNKDEITDATDRPPELAQIPQRPGRKPKPVDRPLVRLEKAPTPRQPRRRKGLLAAAAAIVLAVAVGGWYGWQHLQSSARDGYANLLLQVEKAGDLEDKIKLAETFLKANPHSEHAAEAQSTLKGLRNQKEERDFEAVTLKISSLPVDETYEEKAIGMYTEFLAKYPDSRFQNRIGQNIEGIKNLLDKYYYDELVRAARLDFSARLSTYRNYLALFPEGRFREAVESLIDEMGRKYLEFLKSEADHCEQKHNWEPCLRHADDFLVGYADSPLSDEARRLKKEMVDKQELAQLRKEALEAGTNYQQIYRSYTDYVTRNPDSTQKAAINAELSQLEKKVGVQSKWTAVRDYAADTRNGIMQRIQRVEKYLQADLSSPYASEAQSLLQQLESERRESLVQHRLAAQAQEEEARKQRDREKSEQLRLRALQSQKKLEAELQGSTRFQILANGTFIDLTTGLNWNLLDSYQELGGCLDYQSALLYARNLRNGGYTDWRLPTAGELATIYKKQPYFPASGAEWYWTSEAYAKGYHSVADIVTTRPESLFSRENRTQDQCGAVRAVRP